MEPRAETVRRPLIVLSLLCCLQIGINEVAHADRFSFGTEFVYQGRLHDGGAPADGIYDVGFELYDRIEGGTLLGRVDRLGLQVEGGLLVAELDFGIDVRSSDGGWLQVEVRSAGQGLFHRLEPRQKVTGEGVGCTVDEDVTINGGLFVDAPGANPDITTACCNDVDDGGNILINGFLRELSMDSDEIQATSLGQGADLRINADGGNVGIGVQSADAPLHLPDGPDVQTTGGGSLILGELTDRNLAIDENEIMARTNGVASTLHLNNDGGQVHAGGDLVVDGDLGIGIQTVSSNTDSDDIVVNCPAGKTIVSGGCFGGADEIEGSFPNSDTSWRCLFNGVGVGNTAYAVCARIER